MKELNSARGSEDSRMETRRMRRVLDSSFSTSFDYPKPMMSDRSEKPHTRTTPPGNYIRTCRKRCGLTQKELAFLLSNDDGSVVYRYERGVRVPSLKTALVCEIALGVPVCDLFPDIYHEVECITHKQAHHLIEHLRTQTPDTIKMKQKMAVLRALIAHTRDAPD